MHISNSVAAPIGSHADPVNGPGPLVSQILTGGGRAQQPAPGKSTAERTESAYPGNPVHGHRSVPGLDSPGQGVGRPNSYKARGEARKTNQQPDAAVHGVPVAATSQDARPAQFLAILSDAQDTQAGVAKAQATASYMLSQLAGATLGASYEAAISAATNPDAKPARAENPADGGSQPNNTAAPNVTQQMPTRTIDALLETDQAIVSQVGNEPSAASSSEVAFAARIAFKSTDPRVIAPNKGQAAIAASRFEALPVNAGSGKTQDNRDAAQSGVLAQPEEPAPVVASVFEAMASESDSGEPRGHTEPNASAAPKSVSEQSAGAGQNVQAAQTLGTTTQPAAPEAQPSAGPAIAVQPATGRSHGSQSNSGANAAKTAAAGQVGSSASPGPQNASSGMVAAAPASIEASSGRGSTNAKPVPQEHTAPFVEARDEPVERAAEAVRDISLNLSNKDQNVQVRLSERGGELHVTVRTPDSTLTHGMREGLSDLVGRLERGGYRAETWQPAGSDSRDRDHDSPSRRNFSQQQNAGGKDSGRQQNSQDSESESQRPKWIGELESSFQKE